MSDDDALAALNSDATEERLRAARYLSLNARPAHRCQLTDAITRESVPWVQRALKLALDRADHRPETSTPTIDLTEELAGLDVQQIYAKAREKVAESIIHEISPIVGLLRVVAPQEVGKAYASSRSKRLLDQMQSLLGATRTMIKASATPQFTTFSIAEFVSEIIESTPNDGGVAIKQGGPPTLNVSADRGQLGIALANGLRNALEAVKEQSSVQPPQIVITWGMTGAEYFLVVKDTGPGFRQSLTSAIKMGVTTKTDHPGFGLANAQSAMRSMQGDILLKNDEPGAHYELRWYRDNENPIR